VQRKALAKIFRIGGISIERCCSSSEIVIGLWESFFRFFIHLPLMSANGRIKRLFRLDSIILHLKKVTNIRNDARRNIYALERTCDGNAGSKHAETSAAPKNSIN
jgi:hypothetical protein